MQTRFNKLFNKIMTECVKSQSKLVKEGLFTGDNNFSINVSDNNVSDNNTQLSVPIPFCENKKCSKITKETNNCPTCHGTGYIKSYTEQPDQPCPRCNSAIPDDIGYDSDNLKDPNEVTDDEIDAIIAQNRINRTGLADMYNENKKVVKESSVVLPDEIVKCEICGKDITKKVVWDKHYGNQYQSEQKDFYCEDPEFQHEHICLDCAEQAAKNFKLEFIDNDNGESWIACTGCGQLYPENELNDTDSGMTCDDCINEYDSRGQEYTVYHNRY